MTTLEPASGAERSGGALRSIPLAALVTGELISTFGSQMTFLALPWFVLQTTGSTARMGIVFAAELAPMAILGIPSGAAHRASRRTPVRCSPPTSRARR